jgi:hypothetical protein
MLFAKGQQPGRCSPECFSSQQATQHSGFLLFRQLSDMQSGWRRVDFIVASAQLRWPESDRINLFLQQIIPHGKLAVNQLAHRHHSV